MISKIKMIHKPSLGSFCWLTRLIRIFPKASRKEIQGGDGENSILKSPNNESKHVSVRLALIAAPSARMK